MSMQLTQARLSDHQFKSFSALVYAECGIHLTDEKRELLNARLAKRLRGLNVSAKQYLGIIKTDARERARFIDAVSTNHTYFFRETRPFRFITPACRAIWCAASSSGEEPYSIAAYALENGIETFIWATDISETCLEKGRLGIYKDQAMSCIPRGFLKKYFQKGRGRWTGYIRAKSRLRDMLRFDKFNLLLDRPPDRLFDIIFCRNVMIYFDKPTKEAIVGKLVGVLKPQGCFIIGGAESLSGLTHSLKYIEPSVYQKK